MSVNSKIIDGLGSGQHAKVEDGGYLRVQPSGVPPSDSRDLQTIYRQYLTLNNDGTTIDARVNGSVTPQLFYIQAVSDFDTYITNLSFRIADTNASLNNFGAIGALTNGLRLYYEDKNGETNIATQLQTNFDIVRLCGGNPAFGNTSNSFIAGNIAGNSEGIIQELNFANKFGFNPGLRLSANTLYRLVLEINDNVTGIDAFDIVASGFRVKTDRS